MSDLWIEVDMDAIIYNYRQIMAGLSAGCRLMAVVKADAYGLGAAEVAGALQGEGCTAFAVTTISEALLLRNQGVDGTILVLGPSSPEYWQAAIQAHIELTVSQLDWIPTLNKLAETLGTKAGIQLKLETGMGRTGFTGDQLQELAAALREAPQLEVTGAYTHFARGAQRDRAYTRAQNGKYLAYVQTLEQAGIRIPLKHVCNSAAYLDFPEYHYNMVRVGTLLIGHCPAPAFEGRLRLKDPWLAKARIVHLQKAAKGTFVGYQSVYKAKKDTTLAVVPVGYADGFGIEPRLVPQNIVDLAKIIVKNMAALMGIQLGREKLLCNGQTVRIAGKIGMQLTVLDVGSASCSAGDEIVIPLRRTQANPRILRMYKKNGEIMRIRIINEGFLSPSEEQLSNKR
ncbi:MAG: alanine racemase [Dehalobacter sp. 4CP]|uniref:alanine racemase n=1 Tax=Dehalobacter sp. CP TaxID=2594474 RepID=UPI0013C5A849|nr:alanine racemase [Dehalobacter sp.]NBJ15848.1 alanine racemase [Dehalobacter sp. 4CP]